MLIPSDGNFNILLNTSLSRRVNANSQPRSVEGQTGRKLIKKGEC